jgi:hypothetical protein
VGRAGIEPATLGLKVRPGRLRRLAARGNCLQRGCSHLATSHYEVWPVEASSYAHRTRDSPSTRDRRTYILGRSENERFRAFRSSGRAIGPNALTAAVSKTVSGLWVRRGFKSLPLRSPIRHPCGRSQDPRCAKDPRCEGSGRPLVPPAPSRWPSYPVGGWVPQSRPSTPGVCVTWNKPAPSRFTV